MPAAAPAAPAARYERLDALRGVAIVWMASFHFAFDLNHFGLIERQNFYHDPFWTLQRSAIVTLFLLCAGAGQAVALEGRPGGPGWPRFWRRWSQVALCAVGVSIGSYLMFPRSWISFGVLHGIAVMLILVRLLAPLGRGLWPVALLALLALLLPRLVAHPLFDSRWTNWTGLVSRLPMTEDWVPVLPWLGVMLLGLLAGRWLLRRHPAVLAGPLPGAFAGAALRPLAVLGRWSLTFYMLHQPVLIGLLMAFTALRSPQA